MGYSKEMFREMQEEFLNSCEDYENGNITALDCAVKFKQDNDYLEQLMNERKTWIDENRDSVTEESEQYGKSGYKGFIFSLQTRKTLDFSNIKEITTLKTKIKDIENNGKIALQLIDKGIEPLDVNTGELLPIPTVKTTSFVKIDKAK